MKLIETPELGLRGMKMMITTPCMAGKGRRSCKRQGSRGRTGGATCYHGDRWSIGPIDDNWHGPGGQDGGFSHLILTHPWLTFKSTATLRCPKWLKTEKWVEYNFSWSWTIACLLSILSIFQLFFQRFMSLTKCKRNVEIRGFPLGALQKSDTRPILSFEAWNE